MDMDLGTISPLGGSAVTPDEAVLYGEGLIQGSEDPDFPVVLVDDRPCDINKEASSSTELHFFLRSTSETKWFTTTDSGKTICRGISFL